MKSPLVQAWPPILSKAYRRKVKLRKRRLWPGRSRGAMLRKLVQGESYEGTEAWLRFARKHRLTQAGHYDGWW